MKANRGYYSIVQYCPDLSRLEAANVGVLLFCPELHFIAARVSHNNDRIRRFFSPEQADWKQINALKNSIVRRLEVENETFRTLTDLERFIALQANEIQITLPRPLKVTEPERDLEKLFSELVGGRSSRAESGDSSATEPVHRLLRREFNRGKLDRYLRRDVHVTVKAMHREITVPFGFQNGCFNLIAPARFDQTSAQGVTRAACELAVEGRSLKRNPDPKLGQMQLVVVSAFRGSAQQSQDMVRDIFAENDTELYSLSEVPRLIERIRQTGKPIAIGPDSISAR